MYSEDECNFSDEDIDEKAINDQRSDVTQSQLGETPKFLSKVHTSHPSHEYHIGKQQNNKSKLITNTENFLINKQIRLQELKNEQERNMMEKCTFKPIVNKSKSARNLKQFLESQQEHLIKVDQKTSNLKKKIEEEGRKLMTFSPRINRTKNQQKQNNKQFVHERLYKLKDKNNKQFVPYQNQHIPKITQKSSKMIRNKPVQDLLYEDAIRRAEKQFELPEQEQIKKSKDFNKQKYAAQKILKDFDGAIQKLQIANPNQLTYADFNRILQQLGYTIYSHEITNSLALQQKKLVNEAYKFISKTKLNCVNLCSFLLAINGLYNINLTISDQEEKNVLIISSIEGKKIQKHFELLYRNKLFSDTAFRELKTLSSQENSFTPQINPDSNILAERYRNKMIEKVNDIFSKNKIKIAVSEKGLSHEDLLVIHNIGQNLEKEKMRENKLVEIDPECTFQPNFSKSTLEQRNPNLGKQKCQELYEAAKQKKIDYLNKSSLDKKAKEDKENENLQKLRLKHKAIQQKINNQKTILMQKCSVKSYKEIKDVDKTIARMFIGRQMRNQKAQFLSRGETSLRKNNSQQKNNRQSPLFVVDVNMDETEKQIYFYKGDENRISKIINDFCVECRLDQQTSEYLQQKLTESIRSAFCKQGYVVY